VVVLCRVCVETVCESAGARVFNITF
jgi:hypothetical protein